MHIKYITCCECEHQLGDHGLAIGNDYFVLRHYHSQLNYAQDAKYGQTQRASYGKISGYLHSFCWKITHLCLSAHIIVIQLTVNMCGIRFSRADIRQAIKISSNTRYNTDWKDGYNGLTHWMKPGYRIPTFCSSVVRLFAHLPGSKITTVDSRGPDFGCNTNTKNAEYVIQTVIMCNYCKKKKEKFDLILRGRRTWNFVT